jgi:hypothetical protein
MTRDATRGQIRWLVVGLMPVVAACTLFRPAPVTVQRHADGSVTKMVKVGLWEREEGAKGRLRASIECPHYQTMELGLAAEQAADPSAYWIRYKCEKGK